MADGIAGNHAFVADVFVDWSDIVLAAVARHRAELADLPFRGAGNHNFAAMLAIEGEVSDMIVMAAVQPSGCQFCRPKAGYMIRMVVVALYAKANNCRDRILGYNTGNPAGKRWYVVS